MSQLLLHKYVRELLVLIVFAFGVAIFYGNTLKNGFVFDDHGQVEQNIYIQSVNYLPKIISGCIWESTVGNCNVHYYRPLQPLSYLLTYQISTKPWVFHLINLIYFTISIFLVFILVKLLTKNFLIGFLSALIFFAHPINNESVNWIATVPELLYTIFTLSATIFYFLYRKEKNPRYLVPTYIFYGLGVFSKEPAALLPLIFLTLDLTYFKQRASVLLHWKNIKPYLTYTIIFFIYMGLRLWVLGGFGGINSTYNITIIQRIYIFFDLFSLYIQKLFYPFPLNIYHHFQPSYQFLSLHFLIIILTTFGYLTLGLIAWKKQWFVVIFGLVWFLVMLLPSLIFVNPENLFAERYVFTSTIGFSIITALFLGWLWQRIKIGKVVVIGLVIIALLLLLITTYQRNTIWQNDVSLFTDTLQKSPDADLIRYNLTLEYLKNNNLTRAVELLTQIIKNGTWIHTNRVYGNLGELYLEQGKILESLPYLCKAETVNLDLAAKQIEPLDNKTFMLLNSQMLQKWILSNKNSITLKTKDCSLPQGCLLIFSSTLPKNEFLFPFLVVGKTTSNEVVRSRYFEFNPQTSEIALGIDHQFESSNIHFWFPTCGGIFYEAETTIK